MIVNNNMPADTEQKCNDFRGGLKALSSLVDAQTPGLSVPSEDLAPLIRLFASMVDDVVPGEHYFHPGSSNDR